MFIRLALCIVYPGELFARKPLKLSGHCLGIPTIIRTIELFTLAYHLTRLGLSIRDVAKLFPDDFRIKL